MSYEQDEAARQQDGLEALIAMRRPPQRVEVSHAPSRVDIHEHRAPTDESVRLLAEMEKAAQDRVDRAVRLEGNGFNGVVTFEQVMIDQTIRARCVFDMNGERIVVTESIGAYEQAEGRKGGKDALFAKVLAAVAEAISVKLLAPAFERAQRQGGLA